jgi:hypothetical protein
VTVTVPALPIWRLLSGTRRDAEGELDHNDRESTRGKILLPSAVSTTVQICGMYGLFSSSRSERPFISPRLQR